MTSTDHFVLDMAAQTDRGLVRDSNQDVALVVPRLSLAVVADGMGGHAGGEIASDVASRGLSSTFESLGGLADTIERTKERAIEAFRVANREVGGCRATSVESNMGTTLVASVFAHGRAIVMSVGDSRCYRLRAHELDQLTHDHSYAAELRRAAAERGALEQPSVSEWEHVLTRAVDGSETLVIDVRVTRCQLGDSYLLCSDGLWGPVAGAAIQKILATADDAAGACKALIDAAHSGGGPDNIAVAVVRLTAESLRLPEPFELTPTPRSLETPVEI
jgi:PPM family protein phosphatase